MAGFVNRQVSVVQKQKTGALEGGVEKKQTVTHQGEPSRRPRYRLPVVKLLEPQGNAWPFHPASLAAARWRTGEQTQRRGERLTPQGTAAVFALPESGLFLDARAGKVFRLSGRGRKQEAGAQGRTRRSAS